MTAATTAIEISEASAEKQESCLYYALKANTTIPAGTLAMVVQGNGYAEPYVGNTANAVVLGVSAKTYVNATGSTVTRANDDPMVFKLGVMKQFKTDGTITASDIGCKVGMKDNQTIGHTVATHDAAFYLTYIDHRTDITFGTIYGVAVARTGPL